MTWTFKHQTTKGDFQLKVIYNLRNAKKVIQQLIARFAWAKWMIFLGMLFFSVLGLAIMLLSIVRFSKSCFVIGTVCLMVGARLNIAYASLMSHEVLTRLIGRWSKIASPIIYYSLGTASLLLAKFVLSSQPARSCIYPFGRIGELVYTAATIFAVLSSGLACSLLFYFVLVPEARRFEARMRLIGEFQVRDDP